MDQRNLVSGTIFFLLASALLIASIGLGIGSLSNPQAGFMPCLISVLLLIFSLMLLWTAFKNRSVSVRLSTIWHHISWQKNLIAVILLCLYLFVLPRAGYLPATFILMTALLLLNAIKLWISVLTVVLSVLISYGLFYYLLKTPLPRGIWGF